MIAQAINELATEDEIEQLKQVVYAIIRYRTEHFQLTSFIHRELSLDSTFVREMSVTYLAKENHLISTLFFSILNSTQQKQRSYLYMQLKGMILTPFVIQHEWNIQLFDQYAYENFINSYTQTIHQWIDFLITSE